MYQSTSPITNMPHDPFGCNCFECNPSHPDAILNDHADLFTELKSVFTGEPVKGDVIETSKVVLLYDGKGGVKAISPPRNFLVRDVSNKFVTFANSDRYGKYDMFFINNDPSTYFVVPALMRGTVEGGHDVGEKIDQLKALGSDFFTNLFGKFKWIFIGIIVLLVLLVILRFK